MNIEKFNDIFSDSEFVNKILNAETGEKLRWLLKEKELILKEKDLDFFCCCFNKINRK